MAGSVGSSLFTAASEPPTILAPGDSRGKVPSMHQPPMHSNSITLQPHEALHSPPRQPRLHSHRPHAFITPSSWSLFLNQALGQSQSGSHFCMTFPSPHFHHGQMKSSRPTSPPPHPLCPVTTSAMAPSPLSAQRLSSWFPEQNWGIFIFTVLSQY